MEEKRLSRLQYWILEKCLANTSIREAESREYYEGTSARTRAAKDLLTARAIEAFISENFRDLVKGGFLVQSLRWGEYYLTESGFLTVNKDPAEGKMITFREYEEQKKKTGGKTRGSI